MTTFNFSDVDSDRTGFTFISSDSETFSFEPVGAPIDFSFILDSEEGSLSFVELSPNQTIGTLVENTYSTVGVDSEWVLRQNLGPDSEWVLRQNIGTVDSEWVLSNATAVDSEAVYALIDSEWVQSFKLIESQLEGYTVDPSSLSPQVEQASGSGYFNNPILTPGTTEKITITLDSDWVAGSTFSASGTDVVVTGNSGSNNQSTDLDGTYLRQPLSDKWLELTGSNVWVRSSGNLAYYWYNPSNGMSISRVTPSDSTSVNGWRFHTGLLDTKNYNADIRLDMVTNNNANGTQTDFGTTTTFTVEPGGVIKPDAGGGSGTYGVGSETKLNYAFSAPAIPASFDVDFEDGDTYVEAATAIKTVWEANTDYTATIDSNKVIIDTETFGNITNATITVTEDGNSSNVLFDGSSNTNLSITDGTDSEITNLNSTITYRNVTYVVPLSQNDSDFFQEFVVNELVPDLNFTYSEGSLTLTGTFTTNGPKASSSISVDHGIGDGTFAWDSDYATITQVGIDTDSTSREFFRTIYDENRVIQTINSVGGGGTTVGVDSDWVLSQISGGTVITGVDSDWVLNQISGGTVTGGTDSDWVLTNTYNTQSEIVTLRTETGTTPIVADFNGAIFLGEY